LFQDSDEDRLNHRIPHRFEPITNIGANWCCHCGYMLPLGIKGSKKCTGMLMWSILHLEYSTPLILTHHSECGISCHTKCAHLVPDFCGMSMEMANQMLQEMRAANKRKTPQASVNKGNATWDRPTSTGSIGSQSDLTSQIGKMHLDEEQTPSSPSYLPDTSPRMKPLPAPTGQDPYARPPQPSFDPRMHMPQPQPPPHGTPPNRYAPIPNTAVIGRPPQQIPSPKMQQGYPQPYPVAAPHTGQAQQLPPQPQVDMSRVCSAILNNDDDL
jgi:classical protein kinase C